MFDSRHTLRACGPSDGKEVKDIFDIRYPCQGRFSTLKTPSINSIDCTLVYIKLQREVDYVFKGGAMF